MSSTIAWYKQEIKELEQDIEETEHNHNIVGEDFRSETILEKRKLILELKEMIKEVKDGK